MSQAIEIKFEVDLESGFPRRMGPRLATYRGTPLLIKSTGSEAYNLSFSEGEELPYWQRSCLIFCWGLILSRFSPDILPHPLVSNAPTALCSGPCRQDGHAFGDARVSSVRRTGSIGSFAAPFQKALLCLLLLLRYLYPRLTFGELLPPRHKVPNHQQRLISKSSSVTCPEL